MRKQLKSGEASLFPPPYVVKSHNLHGKVDRPLYLIVDLLTVLGPSVSMTLELKLEISILLRANLLSKNGLRN